MNRTHALAASTILSLLAFTAGPASAKFKEPKPEWVDGESSEYPRAKYLTGVGQGDDRSSAEDRARGEISKIFSTAVVVKTHLNEAERNTTQGGKTDSNFSQEVSQNVQTASQKVLEDVSVVETWRDESVQKYYALAVLDREKSATIIKDKLGDLDKQVAQWKESLDAVTERLPKVKAAMKVLAVLRARADLNGELRVVDTSGKGLPSPVDEAVIRPQAAKALSALNVAVDLTGKDSQPVATGIIKGLSGFGLQAKMGNSEDADIIIEADIQTEAKPAGEDMW